jgi:hypothetical protein
MIFFLKKWFSRAGAVEWIPAWFLAFEDVAD